MATVSSLPFDGNTPPRLVHPAKPTEMIRPPDNELSSGAGCSPDELWEMMEVCARGDLARVSQLLDAYPTLVTAEHWYTQPIHYAVRGGHEEIVRLLLERGADPTTIRYGGDDLRTVAADRGHAGTVALLEAACIERMGQVPGVHAIHEAVNSGETAQVAVLLDKDATALEARDAQGRTPLHLAVIARNVALAELLLQRGANTRALTGSAGTYSAPNFSPLELAVWRSDFWLGDEIDLPMVALLRRYGAEFPLAVAAACGDETEVRRIVAADEGSVNRPRPSGRRPLSAAVQFGHGEIARYLLQRGANPALSDGRYAPQGCSLFFAARQKDHELMELLLDAGADPNSGIDSCGVVWHVADRLGRLILCRRGMQVPDADLSNIEALELWTRFDPESLSTMGCGTIFTMVVRNEWEGEENKLGDKYREQLLRFLLEKGVRVPPMVTGCRGYLWHRPALTRILLEHGMDPNLPNWQWRTPLHDICSLDGRGNPPTNTRELAELFLEFGADINARDEEYLSTPLGYAARNGLTEEVRYLLQKGAAVQLPDDEPWATPLAWATRRGHAEIAELLRAAGAQA